MKKVKLPGHYSFQWTDLIRWAIHLPIGALIAFIILNVSPPLGITVAVFFLAYEVMEDWRIGDRSFKDVFGSLVSMVAYGLVDYLWL